MNTPRARSASLSSRLLVLLGASIVALLGAEGFCRYRAHRLNEGSLLAAFSKPRTRPRNEPAALIDIIQMSANPKIVFELRPNLDAVPFKKAPVTTNRFGFRCRELATEAPPGTITILGLGDSIMFGWGVPYEMGYLALLEAMLQEKYPQRTWRIINTAAPAYNTVMEVETLRCKGMLFEPDLVILNLVPNDLGLPRYVRAVDDVFDLKRSYLVELFVWATGVGADTRSGFDGRDGRDSRLAYRASDDVPGEVPDEYKQLVGWTPFFDALTSLKALSRSRGFPVVTFSTVEDDILVRMKKASRSQGFLHVELNPEIQQYMADHGHEPFRADRPDAYLHSELVLNPDDGHPSTLQHRMAATKLLRVLEDEGHVARLLK